MKDNNFNIGIDFAQLLNTQINDMLLKPTGIDSKCDLVVGNLIKLANRHGKFGIDAMEFISDLVNTMSEIDHEIKKLEDK